MFLSRYDFAGDPQALHVALERVKERIPAGDLLLNVAVSTDSGVSLYDACPDRETFVAFSTSEQLKNMLAESGLPTPTITPLGEILSTVVNANAVPA
jgi:hypothetical protein